MIPKPLDEIGLDDIHALVAVAEEGPTLEFKRDLPGTDRDSRKEFIADVCALANSSGGDLLYGVDEDAEGRAAAVVATTFNPDEVITQLANVLADGLEPRIHGIVMKSIEIDPGERVLVIRVPRSYSGIHRSARDGHFWIRESRSKRQLDVAGIANRFRDLFGREDRVADFFARRYASIGSNSYPMPLPSGPKLVLHLLPLRDFLSGEEVDLSELGQPGQFPVIPDRHSADATMCSDGVLHHSAVNDGRVRASTLLFRSGVVEAVADLGVEDRVGHIPLERVEDYIFKFLTYGLAVAADHLTDGWPISARAAIVGSNRAVGRSQNEVLHFNIGQPAPIRFHDPVLVLPEIFLQNPPGNALPRLLRTPLDRLWQAWGYSRAFSYQVRDNRLLWKGIEI